VIGKNSDDARKILSKAGWKINLKEVDNRAQEGTVVGQAPRGTALPGEVVTLQVSTGNVPPPPPPPGDDRDLGYSPNGEVFDQLGQPITPSDAAQPSQSPRSSRSPRAPQPSRSTPPSQPGR
jgi:beta-lactam-binding protein with PASTA domain